MRPDRRISAAPCAAQRWKIADRKVTGEAAEAQDYLMKQPERIRKLAAFAARKKSAAVAKGGAAEESFSWLFNRKVQL